MAKSKSDDVVSILEFFEELEDPRCSVNQKHRLGDLIVICICGVIAGADGPKAIGVWANANAQWLRQYLELPNGIPSHDTIGRLLATLKPSAFQSCFQKWIASLRGRTSVSSSAHSLSVFGDLPQRSEVIGASKTRCIGAWTSPSVRTKADCEIASRPTTSHGSGASVSAC